MGSKSVLSEPRDKDKLRAPWEAGKNGGYNVDLDSVCTVAGNV